MDTYDGYLGALGFNGNAGQTQPIQQQGTSFADADAARKTGDVQRQLAAAKGDLSLAGEQERQGINTDWEERGLFKSGMRGNSLAQQQGREASKAAMLDAGATADIGNIDAAQTQQNAQQQAGYAQTAANQTMSNMQLKLMQAQLDQTQGPNSVASQQLALAQQQFEEQKKVWAAQLALQQKTSAGNDYAGGAAPTSVNANPFSPGFGKTS